MTGATLVFIAALLEMFGVIQQSALASLSDKGVSNDERWKFNNEIWYVISALSYEEGVE